MAGGLLTETLRRGGGPPPPCPLSWRAPPRGTVVGRREVDQPEAMGTCKVGNMIHTQLTSLARFTGRFLLAGQWGGWEGWGRGRHRGMANVANKGKDWGQV